MIKKKPSHVFSDYLEIAVMNEMLKWIKFKFNQMFTRLVRVFIPPAFACFNLPMNELLLEGVTGWLKMKTIWKLSNIQKILERFRVLLIEKDIIQMILTKDIQC